MMKLQHPIECKNQPKRCKCDPNNWDGWYKICPKFVGPTSDSWCKVCDHLKACHSNPKPKPKRTLTLRQLAEQAWKEYYNEMTKSDAWYVPPDELGKCSKIAQSSFARAIRYAVRHANEVKGR